MGPVDQELKVVANKGELVHRWLTVMREAEKLPMRAGIAHSDLELADARFNDSLVEGVSSRVHVKGNNFQMTGVFALKVGEDRSNSPSDNLAVPRMLQGMDNAILIDIIARGGKPPITNSELQDALGLQLNMEEYEINYDKGEDRFNIKVKDDPELDDASITVVLRSHPIAGSACGIDMSSRLDSDRQKFEKKYEKFGQIMGKLGNAIYQAKGQVPPSKTILLEPPEDSEEDLKKNQAVVRFGKKQLNAAGFFEGDMDDEIDEKIFFEDRPSETFDDVGGQPKAREELETLAYSLRDPEIFRRWGTYPPRRVLLYGPPGTGKTLLTKALANQAEAGIFVVEMADVVHSLYGRSERFIQRVFERAREKAPSILYFDELDALAAHRQHADNVTSRIVNVLLTNLDGMREKDDNVMVVASTNRLDAIDRALLRAGRFDVLVEAPLPDESGRGDIFKIHMRKALNRSGREDLFVADFDLEKLIKATPNFSGADIMEVLRRSLNRKVRQELEGKPAGPLSADEVINEVRNYEDIRIAKERRVLGFDIPR